MNATLSRRRRKLHQDARGRKMLEVYQRMSHFAEHQMGQIEKYPATPYTREHVENLGHTALVIHTLGKEIRAWSEFVGGES